MNGNDQVIQLLRSYHRFATKCSYTLNDKKKSHVVCDLLTLIVFFLSLYLSNLCCHLSSSIYEDTFISQSSGI